MLELSDVAPEKLEAELTAVEEHGTSTTTTFCVAFPNIEVKVVYDVV